MNDIDISRRFDELEKSINVIKCMLEDILKKQATPPIAEKEIMSAKQLSKLVGLDTNVIYAKCAKGEIPCFRIGKQYRFNKHEVFKWMEEQKVKPAISVDDYVERYMQKKVLKG